MIKKGLLLVLATIFLTMVPLAACAKEKYVPFEEQELPKYVVFANSPGGAAEILDTGWARIISMYTPIKGSVTLIANLKDCIEPMKNGEIDMTHLTPPQVIAAYYGRHKGIEPFSMRMLISRSGKRVTTCYGLFTLPGGITKMADIKGKRVGIQPLEPWHSKVLEGALNANGLTLGDVTVVNYANITEELTALVERRIDVAISIAGTKTQEFAKTAGVRLIPLTKEETAAIHEILPSAKGGIVPAGLFGVKEDTWGLPASEGGFWGRTGLNEKTVYTIVKAFWEHHEELLKMHKRFTEYERKNAVSTWRLPYHPGSIRYYREIGIWTDEDTKMQRVMLDTEKEIFGFIADEEAFKALSIIE